MARSEAEWSPASNSCEFTIAGKGSAHAKASRANQRLGSEAKVAANLAVSESAAFKRTAAVSPLDEDDSSVKSDALQRNMPLVLAANRLALDTELLASLLSIERCAANPAARLASLIDELRREVHSTLLDDSAGDWIALSATITRVLDACVEIDATVARRSDSHIVLWRCRETAAALMAIALRHLWERHDGA